VRELTSFEEALRVLGGVVEEAVGSSQRRMVVLAGEAALLAPRLASLYAETCGREVEALFAADNIEGDRALYKKVAEEAKGVKTKSLLYEQTEEVLGTTWDLLFMDLTEQLRPNDLGRLVELVRGGGLIFLLTPPLSEWPNKLTRFQRKLIVPPYTEEDVKRRFIRRFIRKLTEHRGIWVLDGLRLVSGEPYQPKGVLRPRPIPPPKPALPLKLYDMAKTQDQVEALMGFEGFLRDGGRRVLVLIANRGRGKSAALGLGAAGIIYSLGREGRVSIKVTAPDPRNVQAVFEFAEKALKALGVRVRVEERGGIATALRSSLGFIEYCSPYRLIHEKADVAMVDEAAGIPVPLLFKVLRSFRRTIYSSTIHGYEGSGRGFGLRFLKALNEERGLEVEKVELKEPIRYAPGDPIEGWLYDTLLLDAEPPALSNEERVVQPKHCLYEEPDLDRWFLGEEEERLREFIGIYVFAHYRNRPDDVGLLGDAPHHKARVLKLPSGKVAVALHLAEEGLMPDEELEKVPGGYKPPGNIIPVCIARYYAPYSEFAKLRGLRVVRIATHPELMGKGFGSRALNELCKEAKERGYDWVGAGFGGSRELLSFWIKNDFVPVHVSPTRNMVSGEFSVVVVRPLTAKARKLVEKLNREFKARLIDALADPYFNLEASVARLLLSNVVKRRRREPSRLTKSQWSRVVLYAVGTLTYEAASDAVKELLRTHFLSTGSARLSLPASAENLLVAKCLQGKPWSKAASASGVDPSKVKAELRELVKELVRFYGKESP